MELAVEILKEFGLVSISSLLAVVFAAIGINYKQQIEFLKDQIAFHKSMSAADLVSQIKAYKDIAQMEVEKSEKSLAVLHEDLKKKSGANEELEAAIKQLESEIEDHKNKIQDLVRVIEDLKIKSNLSTANEFVLATGVFQHNKKPYVAGVFNKIHMHFSVNHLKNILNGVSENPNDAISKFPDSDQLVLTLSPEGSFKTTITNKELEELQKQVIKIVG